MSKKLRIARVYLREDERERGLVLGVLRDRGKVRGYTVFRGIEGGGAHGQVSSGDLLHWQVSLPIVLEFYDTPEVVQDILAELESIVEEDHIITWEVEALGGKS